MSALNLALVVAASSQSSRSSVQVARSALQVTRFAAGSDLVLRGDLSSRTQVNHQKDIQEFIGTYMV